MLGYNDGKHAWSRKGLAIFIYGESLLELAIRMGVDDLAKDPSAVRRLLGIERNLHAGMELTPPGSSEDVYEQTLYDEFQQRVATLQGVKGEGASAVFKNAMPDMPDIEAYLSQGPNVRFSHGFPREAQDLPMISITLGGEAEGEKYLGQLRYKAVNRRADGAEVAVIGSDMQADYHIHILTPNYDETVVLFHLVKYGLLKYRAHLEGYGIALATMNWQSPEPAPEYLQGGLFIYQRTCVLSCQKDESLEFVRLPGAEFRELEFDSLTAQPGGAVFPQDALIAGDGALGEDV